VRLAFRSVVPFGAQRMLISGASSDVVRGPSPVPCGRIL